jgi:hypothetical protein
LVFKPPTVYPFLHSIGSPKRMAILLSAGIDAAGLIVAWIMELGFSLFRRMGP